MKTQCKELKRIARGNLTGNYRTIMGALIIITIISLILDLPFSKPKASDPQYVLNNTIFYAANFLISIVTGLLGIGMTKIHLSVSRGKEIARSDIYYCFRNYSDHYILSYLLKFAMSILGLLPAMGAIYIIVKKYSLSVLPLIIVLFALSLIVEIIIEITYTLCFYIILDNEDMPIFNAFKLARELMRGNKWRLIYIYLSFIGLELMAILSFGIGALWVNPYRNQTLTVFYLDVIGELNTQNPSNQGINPTNPNSGSKFEAYV